MTAIEPFTIDIPQEDLDDLLDRVARARWANELPFDQVHRGEGGPGPILPGWEYGVPLDYVRRLARYWVDGFDWRAQEARLNEFPQYTAEIDGQNVHFAHVRSANPDATPLILTHGWPNTFVEYLGLVGPLTDPAARNPRSPRWTARIHGCSRAAASTMAPVPSVDPSSTITHRDGRTVCRLMDATVPGRCCSSSLTGLTTT